MTVVLPVLLFISQSTPGAPLRSAFRVPRSAFRVPRSAFRVPNRRGLFYGGSRDESRGLFGTGLRNQGGGSSRRQAVGGARDGVLSGWGKWLCASDQPFSIPDKALSGMEKGFARGRQPCPGRAKASPTRTKVPPGRTFHCPRRRMAAPWRMGLCPSRSGLARSRTRFFPASPKGHF